MAIYYILYPFYKLLSPYLTHGLDLQDFDITFISTTEPFLLSSCRQKFKDHPVTTWLWLLSTIAIPVILNKILLHRLLLTSLLRAEYSSFAQCSRPPNDRVIVQFATHCNFERFCFIVLWNFVHCGDNNQACSVCYIMSFKIYTCSWDTSSRY